jgi:5-methyltetrahydropteroyltriglutamate--homocysteine methyltransferase
MPATAPSGVGINEYYKTEEEYFHALAAELNKEYKGVVAAGFLIQVDDPFLPDIFFEPGLTDAQKRRRAEIYVEASNAPLLRWHQRDRASERRHRTGHRSR